MTHRIILAVPEGFTFEMLSEEQQAGIHAIFGHYEMPIPNTQAYNGTVLCDAITNDAFDPNDEALGITWPIMYLEKIGGEVLVELDKELFLKYLPDKVITDEEGNETSEPAVFHEPHRWGMTKAWDVT